MSYNPIPEPFLWHSASSLSLESTLIVPRVRVVIKPENPCLHPERKGNGFLSCCRSWCWPGRGGAQPCVWQCSSSWPKRSSCWARVACRWPRCRRHTIYAPRTAPLLTGVPLRSACEPAKLLLPYSQVYPQIYKYASNCKAISAYVTLVTLLQKMAAPLFLDSFALEDPRMICLA